MAKQELDKVDFAEDIVIDRSSFFIGSGQPQFGDENDLPEDQNINVCAEKYELVDMIGRGGYGRVWRAEIRESPGNFVALKCIRSDQEGFNSYQTETSMLSILKHENIVKMLDFMMYGETLQIALELHPTTLDEYIQNNGELQLEETRAILKELLQAIEFCHTKSILHLDIKPSNILLSEEGHVKLADFGLSIQMPSKHLPNPNEIVTMNYRAPELLLGSSLIDKHVDMWSIGCTLREMMTGDVAFDGNSKMVVLFKIFKFIGTPSSHHLVELTQMPHFKPGFPEWAPVQKNDDLTLDEDLMVHLLLRLLEPIPGRRISARDALKHPFILGKVSPQQIPIQHKTADAKQHETDDFE